VSSSVIGPRGGLAMLLSPWHYALNERHHVANRRTYRSLNVAINDMSALNLGHRPRRAKRQELVSEEWNVARRGTETRRLTEQVGLRFTPDDLDVLRAEADRRGVTVQQMLREISLQMVRDLGGVQAAS
jgi:hypothetical protein